MSDQRTIERQVAALHRAIADRVRAGDPAPIGRAKDNLERWRGLFGGRLPPAYLEWLAIIDGGVGRILEVLESSGDNFTRLRASSPFTGVLSPQERWRILRDAA